MKWLVTTLFVVFAGLAFDALPSSGQISSSQAVVTDLRAANLLPGLQVIVPGICSFTAEVSGCGGLGDSDSDDDLNSPDKLKRGDEIIVGGQDTLTVLGTVGDLVIVKVHRFLKDAKSEPRIIMTTQLFSLIYNSPINKFNRELSFAIAKDDVAHCKPGKVKGNMDRALDEIKNQKIPLGPVDAALEVVRYRRAKKAFDNFFRTH